MTLSHALSDTRRRSQAPVRVAALGVTAAGLVLAVGAGTALSAPTTRVPLGTATSFVVLAGSGITNTGSTTLGGDLGTFPTPAITNTGGFTFTNGGVNRGSDGVTQGAKSDLQIAYTAAQNAGPSLPVAGGTLGGLTLTPGVYNSGSTLDLTGTLTLDGQGMEDPVFIFQAGSGLTTASSSSVVLLNGASSCNVFWQVGSSATLGTDTTFVGTILAQTSITLTSRASVQGRVLAQNGAVTLDNNTITRPLCQAAVEPSPTPTPAPTATPAPTPTTAPTAPAPVLTVPAPTPGTTSPPTPGTTSPPATVTNPGSPDGTTPGTPTRTTPGAPGTPARTTPGAPGTPSTTTSDGTTGQQITRVPRGGVPAGDGSAAEQTSDATRWTGALGVLLLTGTVAAAARRRRRDA